MIRLRTAVPVLILALASVTAVHAQQPCSSHVECEDSNDCTLDYCGLVATSTCSHIARDGASCDDGNGCTPDDTCQAGTCVAGAVDTCALGSCEREGEEGGACDDDDPCTLDDRCTDGLCAGVALVCDDGVPCTSDFCDDGACTSEADSTLCAGPTECSTSECAPDDAGADAQGCVASTQDFEQAECTEDENPCTVDRCGSGRCAHEPVSDPQGCLPLVPSYRRAIVLGRGVERLLTFVADELDAGGDTGSALVEQLDGITTEIDNAVRVLAGRDADSELPPEALRGLRLAAAATTAQVRGRTALGWLRGTPGRVQRFMGLVAGGRRRRDLDTESAGELRRNGRILLTETKALKRDVKNLQRTFRVFQR